MGEGFEDRERAHQAAVIDLVAATLSAAGPVPPQSWPSPPPSPLHAASSTSAAAPLDEAAAPDTASDSCSHVAMLAQNIATALRNYIATLKPRAVEDGKGSPAVTLLAVVETYADMAGKQAGAVLRWYHTEVHVNTNICECRPFHWALTLSAVLGQLALRFHQTQFHVPCACVQMSWHKSSTTCLCGSRSILTTTCSWWLCWRSSETSLPLAILVLE
eukprot:TRINITY_DN1487_c1_g1_i8.p1 TRINITY_DN1487_c1_g1~~TRINITY_DN1487_c1_g1_i8.p1  ORF type:complete len:217 (+),score=2.48 TRINITY_DN1487_c1_g1_i8:87-737(+)